MYHILNIMLFVYFSQIIQSVNADVFRYAKTCHPANCSQDGVCYCSDRFDGWDIGGARHIMGTTKKAICYRGTVDCPCGDCGPINTKCQDFRCNDENGYYDTDAKKTCYVLNKDGSKTIKSYDTIQNCYQKVELCNPDRCDYAHILKGCQRISAGTCVPCALSLMERYYWSKKGSCAQFMCRSVKPGEYIVTPCGNSSDSVIRTCIEHPENPRGITNPNPVAQFYCPGEADAIRVPENGFVTSDYTGFGCNNGYYKSNNACLQCPLGSCCVRSTQYICPVNYYSNNFGASACKRCTMTCTYSKNSLPLKCQQGSIQNSQCVSCGMCGVYPETGHNCLQPNSLPPGGLPATCDPCDVAGSVATCC